MKLQRKVKLLAVPAIFINLMLTYMAAAQASDILRGYTQTCKDLVYQEGELSAKCRTIEGEYQKSSIELNKYIANQDGVLVWSREGNYVDTSGECSISTPEGTSTSSLMCNSKDTRAELILDEHIENVDGQLQYYE